MEIKLDRKNIIRHIYSSAQYEEGTVREYIYKRHGLYTGIVERELVDPVTNRVFDKIFQSPHGQYDNLDDSFKSIGYKLYDKAK